MKIHVAILASALAAGAAFGGVLTAPAKVAAKIAEHGADNVVEHVVTHNADDIAKVAARGGAKAATKAVPKVMGAVDAAIEAAKVEARATKPVVSFAARPPIHKPASPAVEAFIRESPKIAVAAGIGGAAIAASHNLTAGEREIDRATGDVIRDNPDIAIGRIKGSGQWRNTLATFCGIGALLVGLAIALRVAGPLLRFRRQGRPSANDTGEDSDSVPQNDGENRTQSTKEPGTMDNDTMKTDAMTEMETNATTQRESSHGFSLTGFLLLLLLALLVVSTILSSHVKNGLHNAPPVSSGTTKSEPASAAAAYPAEIRRYNDAVSAALERHLKRLVEIETKFENGLRENGPARFDGARAAIPGIRRHFSSFGEMSGVVKDGALDKVLGGDRLQERFNVALDKPFIRPCALAGESLVADYEAFALQMAAEGAAFRKELESAHGQLPEAVRAEFPGDTLRVSMANTYRALNGMPLKAGLVAAETAIEVAAIRSTVAAARRLAIRYGGKAIAKGAVTAAAPAADGPLPIGDVIAVGCAVWTVWDIYDLTSVLPREIARSLNATVDAIQSQTIDAVSEAARKTLDAHRQAARSMAAKARF